METIAQLTARHHSDGAVQWIGVRPERRQQLETLVSVPVGSDGLLGDHAKTGKRAVTLVQHEHLAVISALLGGMAVDAAMLRRNLSISGINIIGLKNRRFRIGSALLEGTGICAPCSRMEEILGPGGYTALRGHGGITARVLEPGNISLQSTVSPA